MRSAISFSPLTQPCFLARLIRKAPPFRTPEPFLIHSRSITVKEAREILGISPTGTFTASELRVKYFEEAKRCHPDSTSLETISAKTDAPQPQRFHLATEAYELLQKASIYGSSPSDLGITHSEDAEYRMACQVWLGIDAEVVEESKQCPAFRQWLQGKTDAAFHWRLFFMKHGGLARKLRTPIAQIGQSQSAAIPQSSARRRRPSSKLR